jgi:ACS family D-galactonate transporter-like MFS transporter
MADGPGGPAQGAEDVRTLRGRPVTLAGGRTLTVALIVLCLSLQALTIGGLALFLPRVREELGLSYGQGGSLAATASLVYAFLQMPAGYLADRLGPRRLFLTGALGVCLLSFTFGLVQGYWQALANQAALGVAWSLLFAPGLVLMTGRFPPERRATAMGLYVAAGFSLPIVLLNLVGPALEDALGWRRVFTLFALMGLAFVALFARYVREEGHPGGRQRGEPARALALFASPIMWVIAVIQYVRMSVVVGLTTWLPTFLLDEHDLSLRAASLVVALSFSLTAVSPFLGGYLSDRLRSPTRIIGASLVALAVANAGLASVHWLPALVLLIALTGFFMQMYFGPLFSLPLEMLGPRMAGVASGYGNFFANLGSFSFAYALGAIKDSTGSFDAGFYALALACTLSALLSLPLARMRQRAAATPAA